MQDRLKKIKSAAKGISRKALLPAAFGAALLYGDVSSGAEYQNTQKTEASTAEAIKAEASTAEKDPGAANAPKKSGDAEGREKRSLENIINTRLNKVVLERKFLENNPALWNDLLTYEKDGEEYLAIPPALMDHISSEKNPELEKAELLQRGRDISLRRHYNIKKDGKTYHDEVELKTTLEELKDYWQGNDIGREKRYRYIISTAVGADPEGMFTELGARYELDNERAFSFRVYWGESGYNLDVEAENKGESMVLSRGEGDVSGTGKIPDFKRTDWSIAKVERDEDSGKLARIVFSSEQIKDSSKKEGDFGEWKEDDSLRKVEYGEAFVVDNKTALMYVLGHDGRDPGAILSLSYRSGNSDSAKDANKELMMTKLIAKEHDSTVTGNHSVKAVVDVGYYHGQGMAEGTYYLLDGQFALIAGTGRSTETNPMDIYGNPGDSYAGFAIGGGAITKVFEKVFGKEEYSKPLAADILDSFSVKFIRSIERGEWEWRPQVNFKDLQMQEDYRRGR